MDLSAALFEPEIAAAVRAYEKHIVCLEKTTDDFQAALVGIMEKAIKAYLGRGPNLRHGIALDRYVTIIISQTLQPRPLCGIYFNLHSPYQKGLGRRSAKTS